MDWSDAEAKGLREAVGDGIADNILRGCNVHWTRSYQRVAERVAAKEKLAIDTFCKIAKCITEATEKQDVYKLFDVLQGTATLDSIQHLNLHLPEDQKNYQPRNGKRLNNGFSGGSGLVTYECFVNHFH